LGDLTKGAAAVAAINLNQNFKKGKHKYENQNERQGFSHQWRYPHRWLKPGNQTLFHRKENMKIKTNVKAGEKNGAINVGG
jgi:hypothetical protein